MRRRCASQWLTMALFGGWVSGASAEVITLRQGLDGYAGTRDTSIMAESGFLSAGGDDKLFIGRTQGRLGTTFRRALIRFDLEAVAPGSEVTRVTLTLRLLLSGPLMTTDRIELHRLTSDWGEGTVEGPGPGAQGGFAMIGDATWTDNFFDISFWTTDGGDFDEAASASLSVTPDSGLKTFASTPDLVADVQGWVDDPTTNFGWILIGDETTPESIKLWASKENSSASVRPTLEIELVLTAVPGDLDGDGDVDLSDYLALLGCVGGPGQPLAAGCEDADLDGDGDSDLGDVVRFQGLFTGGQ